MPDDNLAARTEDFDKRIMVMERRMDVQENTCQLTITRIDKAMEKHSAEIQKTQEVVETSKRWTIGLLLTMIGLFLAAMAIGFPLIAKAIKP